MILDPCHVEPVVPDAPGRSHQGQKVENFGSDVDLVGEVLAELEEIEFLKVAAKLDECFEVALLVLHLKGLVEDGLHAFDAVADGQGQGLAGRHPR